MEFHVHSCYFSPLTAAKVAVRLFFSVDQSKHDLAAFIQTTVASETQGRVWLSQILPVFPPGNPVSHVLSSCCTRTVMSSWTEWFIRMVPNTFVAFFFIASGTDICRWNFAQKLSWRYFVNRQGSSLTWLNWCSSTGINKQLNISRGAGLCLALLQMGIFYSAM